MTRGPVVRDSDAHDEEHGASHPNRSERRYREALEQALRQLRELYAYEQAKRDEWFEIEDREMYAYHRGYERGVERSLATLESALGESDRE
jgi:hypothetical protein